MSKLKSKPSGYRSDISPRALERWNPAVRAAVDDEEQTITIYGPIGDWYYEGVTLKRIDAALRAIGDKPVTVYINSPGGDMFEGIAIYNRLREHSRPVTTKIIGIAASAASVIAMAGQERLIATSGFLMIHDCWVLLAGNRHYLRDVASDMEEFDAAMADIYAEVSGQPAEDLAAMMDDETYIRGKRAIELGLATGLLSDDEVAEVDNADNENVQQANALRALDMALAKAGLPRSERRRLISAIKPSTPSAAGADTPSAVGTDTPSAVHLVVAKELTTAIASLKGILPIR